MAISEIFFPPNLAKEKICNPSKSIENLVRNFEGNASLVRVESSSFQ
jgi:hypothetical protein